MGSLKIYLFEIYGNIDDHNISLQLLNNIINCDKNCWKRDIHDLILFYVVECQNKVVNIKYDGWLRHLCQISHDGKIYNNKFEDKFGLRMTCFICFNDIVYALDEELNKNNEISNNNDDENLKTSIMIMGDDKGDSDSWVSVSSIIDNEEDDEDILLNKKGKTCNKACDDHTKCKKGICKFCLVCRYCSPL